MPTTRQGRGREVGIGGERVFGAAQLRTGGPLAYLQVAYCTSQNTYLDGRRPQFEVPYDVLVVSIGERPATFGTPGVAEHCFFMKASAPACFGWRAWKLCAGGIFWGGDEWAGRGRGRFL